jgi:uncharacterized protein (DUF2147 family)
MKYVFISFFLLSLSPAMANDASIYGLWKTQDQRAKIEIKPCSATSQEICGVIVELREPIDPETGQAKKDKLNPDSTQKERPLLGILNLFGFKVDHDNPTHWTDGKIYSPREGETYSCEMTLIDVNTLEVHGYIGLPIFGKTQTWSRTTKDEKLAVINESE